MKNKALKIILKFSYYALCGYLVGLLISYISPTGTSQNAPFTCVVGSMTFLFFKDYIIPYYRNQIQQK
ncbi:hypothetical protein [Empedobacter falsenii]|uniref:Uncharacterized protein n=1 Tax=Empedobacter falsenii TaxID=343874 RepID=A0AAW7DFV8_9FLAO|nr:hypothetical protein [Empedobacter falsenii]MDM1550871.1 hypothetical protein [Empedobacter falsenii]